MISSDFILLSSSKDVKGNKYIREIANYTIGILAYERRTDKPKERMERINDNITGFRWQCQIV